MTSSSHVPASCGPDRCPAIRVVMMPRDTNAAGTIFGGLILSHIDLAAAVESHNHHEGKLVTVAMDEIVFRAPVFVGDVVSFYTKTLKTGRTSVKVDVEVVSESRFGSQKRRLVTEAVVTMVAVDDEGNSIPLNQPT
jgi:acyl-CoA thioesterase YciA